VLARELARSLGGMSWVWAISSFAGAKAVAHGGSPEQQREYLPKIAGGEIRFSIADQEANMVKVVTSEYAVAAVDRGIQILGGVGISPRPTRNGSGATFASSASPPSATRWCATTSPGPSACHAPTDPRTEHACGRNVTVTAESQMNQPGRAGRPVMRRVVGSHPRYGQR
jgi:Acyl-CoA dehydrogenase, N-terminal domain